MSVSFSCHCPERKKPVKDRKWIVLQRRGNASAFNGYHWQASDWSHLHCLGCGASGRTKAAYVSHIPDGTHEQTTAAPLHNYSAGTKLADEKTTGQ